MIIEAMTLSSALKAAKKFGLGSFKSIRLFVKRDVVGSRQGLKRNPHSMGDTKGRAGNTASHAAGQRRHRDTNRRTEDVELTELTSEGTTVRGAGEDDPQR